MQACGNPPEALLKSLAPDLDLGPDGQVNLSQLAGDCCIM
jgi:hypothetical protein